MSYEVRYYQCPNPSCNLKPHIKITEKMKGTIIEMECEYCGEVFEVDEQNTPQAKPETHSIMRTKP